MPCADDTLARANLDNLTALWRAMGAVPVSEPNPLLAYRNLSWPNRCWFETLEGMNGTAALEAILADLPAGTVVPVWESPLASELTEALVAQGYRTAFQQTAMTLNLRDHALGDTAASLKDGTAIALQRVDSAECISTWCDVGGSAFAYDIDPAVIKTALGTPGLELYLAIVDGAAVATALLLQTGETAGVHQVGVPATFRGRGIAKALMHRLLARSLERGARRVTLQASVEGAPLYRAMDFSSQFCISNYRREA